MNTEENDLGYKYQKRKNGEIAILRYGKIIVILRDEKANEFFEIIERCNDYEVQLEMARITGNYKRGNERLAKTHPRNRI